MNKRTYERIDLSELPQQLRTVTIVYGGGNMAEVTTADASRGGMLLVSNISPLEFIGGDEVIVIPSDESFKLIGDIAHVSVDKSSGMTKVGIRIEEFDTVDLYRELLPA